MNTPHQYVLLSSPPEKEQQFQRLKQQHKSFHAFHGSGFGNWHSILRIGLRNYSNTPLMSAGAAFGPGIYLAPDSGTSLGYARTTGSWSKRYGASKRGESQRRTE
jgi:poly [ADP-ribose] polymerase 6/8